VLLVNYEEKVFLMFLFALLIIPIIGIFILWSTQFYSILDTYPFCYNYQPYPFSKVGITEEANDWKDGSASQLVFTASRDKALIQNETASCLRQEAGGGVLV
jgi:hypothetical protein